MAVPGPFTSCSSPVVGSFTSQSSGNAIFYTWHYSTWQNVNVVNQGASLSSITLTFSQGSNNPYTIYPAWTPVVTLDVLTAAGCAASYSMSYHTILRPTSVYVKNKKEGCAPLAVSFTNTSNFFTWDPVVSYTWCNGASPPLFVSGNASPTPPVIPPQTFTYNTPGMYFPYLIVKTQHGCTDISYADTIIVEDPPSVSFNFNPSSVCWDQPVQIVNTTASSATVQHWHVTSDNGFFSGCVSDPNPSWNFTHVGMHPIKLTGYQNGCKGSSVSSQSVQVKGPIVSGRFQTNCDVNRKSVRFYSYLQECQYATINFGDTPANFTITGNANANIADSTDHIYTNTGTYTVILKGYNTASGCTSHSVQLVVNVRDIQAAFSFPQPTVCVNISTAFNAGATDDAYMAACAPGKYFWYFDNFPPQPSTGPLMYHAFNTVGTHTVLLYVKDENSCTSTITKTIGVSGPVIQFSASPNPVCASNGTVQFTNNTPNSPDPIIGYTWYFGNGQILSTTSNTIPLQTYSNATIPFSNYTVALTATNAIGCVDTKTLSLQVIKPNASFLQSQQYLCVSGSSSVSVTFTSVVSHPSYTYNFGTSPGATLATSSNTVSHSFGAGTFTVKVTVKDNLGCQNSSSVIISAAQSPTADFIYFSDPPALKPNSICSNATMTFVNTSQPTSNNYTPNWDLGNGFGQVVPQNTVQQGFNSLTNTVIPISLMVNTGSPHYCQAVTTKNFSLYVVKANMALANSTVCLGGELTFSIQTHEGVHAWVWDYGDLSFSPTVTANSSTSNATSHTYTNYPAGGNATVSLIYFSADFACRYYDERPIKIIKVDADFKRNNEALRIDSVHCLRIPDTFNNVVFPGSPGSLSYNWQFPGGATSTGTSPAFTFPSPGVFQVTLSVTDNVIGCTGKAIRNMTILPLPTATVTTGMYCTDRPFLITASLSPGVVSGTWSPASGIIGIPTFTTLSGNVSSTGTISESTSYFLNVTDVNNCVSDTIEKRIEIYPPPFPVRWDTTVVIGQPIPINGNIGNFTYTWTPVTADLSCTLCPNPVSTTTVNITYSVEVEDLQKCAVITSTYNIIIEPKTSVDVPTAFTPNGDGRNDIIYVDGWGLRKLNYFRIYNRWGQLLFETNDIKTGWDGTYQGVPQNMETYVYQVSVETLVEGRILEKTSTFKLLR